MNFISKNSLNEYITFFGVRTGEEKWKIISENTVLLHPTYWDGVPLSILEALAMGLTVISTPVGGIPDTIKNEINGLILQENTPEKIADALSLYANNRLLLEEISSRNKKLFKEKYELNIFLEKMDNWLS